MRVDANDDDGNGNYDGEGDLTVCYKLLMGVIFEDYRSGLGLFLDIIQILI